MLAGGEEAHTQYAALLCVANGLRQFCSVVDSRPLWTRAQPQLTVRSPVLLLPPSAPSQLLAAPCLRHRRFCK